MDTTQQTINEIRGTYTDLIDRMHEERQKPPDATAGIARSAERRKRTRNTQW